MEVKKHVKKRELQSFIGKLQWAATVHRSGRSFIRRLINLNNTLKLPFHRTRLTKEAQKDIEWWGSMLSHIAPRTRFKCDLPLPTEHVYADACHTGGGAMYKGDWFYVSWEKDFCLPKNTHINDLELITMTLAARRWGHLWSNRTVVLHSDNTFTVFVARKCSTRSVLGSECLRELSTLALEFNFNYQTEHIKGILNVWADSISRLDECKKARWFFNELPRYGLPIYCSNNMSAEAYYLLKFVHMRCCNVFK